MKIALVQMRCTENKEENVKKTINYVREASTQGAELICLQELFSTIYFPAVEDTRYFALAERIPGPTINRLCDVAKRFKVSMIASIFEEDTEVVGIFYNTAVVIGSDGNILGKYRKTHIPQLPGYKEKFSFKLGNLPYSVFDTGSCKLGVVLCYDRHFPEPIRVEAIRGAQIVFVPTCTAFYPETWELELRAHAAFNTMFVAGVNRVGKEFPHQAVKYFGKSLIANPRGDIVAQAGEDEELLIVDVNLGEVRERRKIAPFLRDRRPELYEDLVRFL